MLWLLDDVRYGARALAKSPSLSLIAIFSLGLGIGANSTVFSLVSAIFLRPLPVRDASTLAVVFTHDPKAPGDMPQSYPNYRDFRDHSRGFSSLAVYVSVAVSLTGRNEPAPAMAQLVSGNYFQTLGIDAAAGRLIGPEDDRAQGAHPMAVLSHGLWQRRFGGDPAIVGQTVGINGAPYTVIGVAGRGFQGLNGLVGADLWLPVAMHARILPNPGWYGMRRALVFSMFGRLAPGVSLRQAEDGLQSLALELARAYPRENEGRTIRLAPLAASIVQPKARGELVASGAVLAVVAGLVLLIACANVAGLLLVRATVRVREVAIRVALGASRARIARQFAVESLLLSLAGAAVGVLAAGQARQWLWSVRPPVLRSLSLPAALDWKVLLFGLSAALFSVLLFGLFPALRASRPDLAVDLKDRVGGASAEGTRVRNALVVGQVALSVVALAGAALYLGGLAKARRIDPGFRAEGLVLLQVNLATHGYGPERGLEFGRRAAERIGAVPGVVATSISSNPPFVGGFLRSVLVEGRDAGSDAQGRFTLASSVLPGYLRTIGIPLVRGRDFTTQDAAGAPRVAIVNDTMAARYWPGEDAIGKRFRLAGEAASYEVVGIARTVNYLVLGEDPRPHLYTPLLQTSSSLMTVHARVSGDDVRALSALKKELHALEPDLLIEGNTMRRIIDGTLWQPRLLAALLSAFGVIALALTIVGLYGVIAYAVETQRREWGVRMALGASSGRVQQAVVMRGLRLTLVGLVVGSALAFSVARALAGATASFRPAFAANAPVLACIPVVLAAAAAAASWFPARRAVRIDPASVLRSE